MSEYRVLVDSSVWIDYFRNGNNDKLDSLIREDLICTNELIVTELIPVLTHQNHPEVVDELLAIHRIPLFIDWDIIRDYQTSNLALGINNVGIPDLIIQQQVILHKLTLFSFDKHFQLMQKYLKFDLMID